MSAVTLPDELTLTMLASDDTQLTVRPVSTFPAASFSVTTACADWPTVIVGATVRVMLATGAGALAGAVTVSVALPVLPSEVAVTVTDPALSALILPAPSTDAIAGSDVVQTIVRPVRTWPLASFVVAFPCVN